MIDLRFMFANVKEKYDAKLTCLLNMRLGSFNQFNDGLSFMAKSMQEHTLGYRNEYMMQTVAHPYKVLQTEYMIGLLEGQYYQIEAVDLYNGVQELKSSYKKEYYLEVMRYSVPEGDGLFVLKSTLHNKDIEPSKPQLPSNNSQMQFILNESHFKIFEDFHLNDPSIAKLIGQNRLQKALWELRKRGFEEAASRLETHIYYELMHPEAIVGFSPLGGGISKSFKVEMPGQVFGVFKPKAILNFRRVQSNLFAYIAANHKNEVAAYHMDRLLDMNLVPITKVIVPQDKKVGSLQYFVKKSYNARKLSPINPRFPIKRRKLSKPKGRTILSQDVMLFDWIIDNVDRNLDNYLMQFDGQFVLIDHGFSFVTSFYFQPKDKQVKKMSPSPKLLKKIIYLKNNPTLVPQAISHLVGQDVANTVQKRIDFIGNFLESNAHTDPGHEESIEPGSCT
ncbi:MAG: hypothetical protein HRU09_11125 [Oligoflexales bacterium]|nr:hypothetical protein [Oligoflexales bacterium]